ncbi:MAG: hypothetical protein RJQ04_02990 [Longimicrobiales bacterium]
MPAWKRRAYVAVLTAVILGSLGSVALELATLWVPIDVPVEFEAGHPTEIVEVSDDVDGIEPGDRIVAVDGWGVDAGSLGDTRRRFAEAGLRNRRGPWTFTLEDSLGESPRRVEVALEADRDLWGDLFSAGISLPGILAGALGLLVLGARDRAAGVERFVVLCIASGLPLLVMALPVLVRGLYFPLWANASSLSGWYLLGFLLWPLVFGHALIRFLHDFLDSGPEERARFPSPPIPRLLGWVLRVGLALMVVLTGVAVVAPDADVPGTPFEVLDFGLAMTVLVSIGSFVAFAVVWMVGATRTVLALIRARRPAIEGDPEAAQRLRVALLGFKVGAVAFGAVLGMILVGVVSAFTAGILDVLVGGPDERMEFSTPEALGVAVAFVGWASLFLALSAPFVGIGMAVLRRGLWNVDLIASRTMVASFLGFGFVGVWAVADELLEAVVPGDFALAGPVVAGLVVAGVRAPVTRAVRRRFFPESLGFPEAVARATRRLAAVDARPGERTTEDAARLLDAILREEIGADPVGVVTRAAGEVTVTWTRPVDGLPSSHALVGVLDALHEDPVPVRTDAGPFLAVPVGVGEVHTAALLGPRGGGRLYDSSERRLLGLLLAPVGRLFENGPGDSGSR